MIRKIFPAQSVLFWANKILVPIVATLIFLGFCCSHSLCSAHTRQRLISGVGFLSSRPNCGCNVGASLQQKRENLHKKQHKRSPSLSFT
ncbi:hypothetical protein BC939DRAFT_438832 [Gamsiella multidivaricata]|uniref:uncharacterized protein n=1 Tax=Gamsiella multidivaricata TaxID=101098 RepID=UPI00221F3E38|nr:uncharacterized protein BC939DRAFT_438832 [Gamsiella multidivaricata]KAI7830710.1 hypothetical protein BC939DRAFT_438832 [Gamsiella multidivaricata]